MMRLDMLELGVRHMATVGSHPEIGMLMMWLFFISETIRSGMRAREPLLALLGYWAMFWSLMDSRCWYLSG